MAIQLQAEKRSEVKIAPTKDTIFRKRQEAVYWRQEGAKSWGGTPSYGDFRQLFNEHVAIFVREKK